MFKSFVKYFKLFVFLTHFCFSEASLAQDIVVFDVRRPLSLENGKSEPRDFYINGGVDAGLKVGMTITVQRRQTLYDPYKNKSPGDLMVPVGRLKIIHTQQSLSVAREVDILKRDQLPVLDYDAIMTGDRLDMTTAKSP